MWKDTIVEEIYKYRDEYAKQFNYDIHLICQDVRKKQGEGGRRVVTLKARQLKQGSNVGWLER
ncbi:MAG: hypothetical protein DRR16_18815 [Candidatus Parabeggiatoa sp. nov. 3]|nr:MAG: hypothetical protein DRR00_00785 [Gammaproteobacteria bacterium]RKZ66605.1 MAG: hypothetical protein DRQ99_09155 [Gammaproteobacteria bacterium]RKZ82816.1 MAG: hypothetical protein DRR16_18815 [Gammaproteobacteria bacterium]HEW98017.1 hypothetical protein [Beggiatoa sp.]